MAYKSAFLVFVVLVGGTCTEGKESCENQRAEKCMVTPYPSFDGPFPDEKFLQENCVTLLDKIRCSVEHNKTCIEPVDESSPFGEFSALEDLVAEFCDENSELHRKYIENIECVNDHKMEIMGTIRETAEPIYAFGRETESQKPLPENIDFDYVLNCLLYEAISSEIGNVLRSNCGEDAADIFYAIKDRYTNNLSRHCEQFSERIPHYNRLISEFNSQNILE